LKKHFDLKVVVNNKEIEISEESNVNDLISEMNMPNRGIAVAINNEVVPKDNWSTIKLEKEMRVTLIKATQGG